MLLNVSRQFNNSESIDTLDQTLKTLLSEILPAKELSNVYNSYDIIGNIAIIRLSKETKKCGKKIAWALMSTHPSVKTVLAQTSGVSGEFRLRKLSHVPVKGSLQRYTRNLVVSSTSMSKSAISRQDFPVNEYASLSKPKMETWH